MFNSELLGEENSLLYESGAGGGGGTKLSDDEIGVLELYTGEF